ncbi:MAG: Fic family protein [Raoultibacter sp.]
MGNDALREIGNIESEDCLSVKGSNTYIPHPIAQRSFSFRGETLASDAKAEMALVRLDEMVKRYPYASALRRILFRVESLATVRSDGIVPDLMQILFLELICKKKQNSPRLQKVYLRKNFPESSLAIIEASYEAFCCLQTLQYIMAFKPRATGLTCDDLWCLYHSCMRGTRRERAAGFRREDAEREGMVEKISSSGVLYIPSSADQIEPLLQDLVDFCNGDSLSPLTRSAVEHFQLEAIQPVHEGADRLGRMFAFLIWKQCGLVESVFPPFSLTPAVQTQKHTELLIPYRTGQDFAQRTAMAALDNWVAHCTRATNRSVKLAYIYRDFISETEEKWRTVMPDIYKGSVLDLLLAELPGMPIVSVASVSEITGKKFQAAAEAVARLIDVGILFPLTSGKRNRIFIAQEVVDRLTQIDQMLLPKEATAREAFFK